MTEDPTKGAAYMVPGGQPGFQNTAYSGQQPMPQAQFGQPGAVTYTTVNVMQPQAAGAPQGREWSSGLCSCFDDMSSCCCVFFCGLCYGCYMYSDYDENCCLAACFFGPLAHTILRVKHRHRHNIEGNLCNDCCVTYWCEPCSMCQLKRDMDHTRNSKGWL